MDAAWVFSVVGDTRYGPDTAGASDSALVKVPARWYATVDGQRVLVAQVVGREMRQVSEMSAANLGERLHHAEWVITSDPARVREIGMTHDCADCFVGAESAVAWLQATPGGEIAAGLLWWAADGPPGP